MEKVKVSKEVFEALKNAESFFDGNLERVVIDIVKGYNFKARENQALNTVGKDIILKIYKYGYELEETPEEKLLKYYKELGFMFNSSGTKVYVGLTKEQDIIFETLSILGIKIKGINE